MSNITVTVDGAVFDVDVQVDAGGQVVATVGGQALAISGAGPETGAPIEWILVDGRSYELVIDRQLRWIRSPHGLHHVELRDRATPTARPASGDGRVKAPIPGTIARVLVRPGDHVEAGQPLLVLEAMKMENQISAPRAGTVERLHAEPGQNVTLHAVLAEIV